jgi:Xaa-Pro aminopeptidase
MRLVSVALVALVIALVAPVQAQHYQTDFPPDEFKARWTRLFDRIGDDAVAVVHGAGLATGYNLPRQSNTFYYLTGIETPHAYLRLDGRTKKVTLYLPPRNERLERAEGRVYSAEDGEVVMRLVGVDTVASTASMGERWPLDEGGAAVIYAEFAPAEGYAESRGELIQAQAAIAADPWDGRTSRESRFRELLFTQNPRAELKNLTPILDELRAIKSEREIALVRRASQLAGLALMEAMRSTQAGVWEYQLDAAARYVFIVNGARLDAYRPITASGTENINNMHYYRSSRQLRDGDLVLMDYAPDYRYYVSDVGRVWPVSGKYLPWQRELLQFVLEYHKVVLSKIRPGVTPQQILASAKEAMQPVFARTSFSKPVYEAAAKRLVETGGGALSHMVGMAVHDVGSYRTGLLPGHVFSIDPQLRVPEEELYLRYEDTIVVTESGYENFTHFLPMELDAMEALVREQGIVQKFPEGPADSQLRRSAK